MIERFENIFLLKKRFYITPDARDTTADKLESKWLKECKSAIDITPEVRSRNKSDGFVYLYSLTVHECLRVVE